MFSNYYHFIHLPPVKLFSIWTPRSSVYFKGLFRMIVTSFQGHKASAKSRTFLLMFDVFGERILHIKTNNGIQSDNKLVFFVLFY